MTNDEDRMTKEVRSTNDELPGTHSATRGFTASHSAHRHSGFEIRHSLRHSDFVIDLDRSSINLAL